MRLIDSARSSIRLAAYAFTSPAVTRALIAAKKRGVDVAVLVDHKSNLVQDASGKATAALNALSLAGVATATVARYPIHHDKYIVVDAAHVETGSFNFSNAAEFGNSENVLVLWNSPQVARAYLAHWASRSAASMPYRPGF
ncbi:phospholipase D family protein [Variovorax sp. ZS18.2.2]|uniref:phospholipase D family nuclease n=1 Tax=Variovorax sp. ZS18.2.2 TaxID=2971255 RepID=UPI0027E51C5A|nr:phospholipase D family protein [Variovorax sp. ZS18.2.2]